MDTIDWESQQLKVFDALKEGNAALNKLHEEMPLDKVEDLLADTAESIAMEQVRRVVVLVVLVFLLLDPPGDPRSY